MNFEQFKKLNAFNKGHYDSECQFKQMHDLKEKGVVEEAQYLFSKDTASSWDNRILEWIAEKTKNKSLKRFLTEHIALYEIHNSLIRVQKDALYQFKLAKSSSVGESKQTDYKNLGVKVLRMLSGFFYFNELKELIDFLTQQKDSILSDTKTLKQSLGFYLISDKEAQESFFQTQEIDFPKRNESAFFFLRDQIGWKYVKNAAKAGLSLSKIKEIETISGKIPQQANIEHEMQSKKPCDSDLSFFLINRIGQWYMNEAKKRDLSLQDIHKILKENIDIQFVYQVIDNGGTLELAYEYARRMQS